MFRKQSKLMLVMLTLLVLAIPARAESLSLSEVASNLPALKQGIAYSIEDSKINYLSTIEMIKWKGFALEAGYAGAAEETSHKAVGVISYQVAKLKDYGVTLPVLDLLEFNLGVYAGYGRIHFAGDKSNDNEFDYGVSATLLNIKF